MDEQLVQQITDNISKNPTCESYHIQKFFGDKPIEEYNFIRFMEEYPDGSVAPGIKDTELLEILLYRNASNEESVKLINKLKTLVNG